MSGNRRRRRQGKEGAEESSDEMSTGEKRQGKRKRGEVSKKRKAVILLILLLGLSWFAFQWILVAFVPKVNSPLLSTRLELTFNLKTWGTLRSGLYFGLKTMSPHSLVTGMMWFRNRVEGNTIPIRHWSNQWDNLAKYGWLEHDFHSFGVQEIIDADINLVTTFVINEEDNSWTARIRVTSKRPPNQRNEPISLLYYAATETPEDSIQISENVDSLPRGPNELFLVEGSTSQFERFTLSVGLVNNSKNVVYRSHLSTKSFPELVYLKEAVLKNLYIVNQKNTPNSNLYVVRGDSFEEGSDKKANFIAHQIVFHPPLEVEVKFKPRKVAPEELTLDDDFERVVSEKSKAFDEKFERVFGLKRKGYSEEEVSFAKAVASNMLGSIGYFYGFSQVKSEGDPEPVPYGPLQLLSAVPSRSFFPRGFLWDEGFHNLLISRFDPKLSAEIVKSWLNLVNSEGWIPREVILGHEAEARVPKEFVVQKNSNANPPTLFLTLQTMLDRDLLTTQVLRDIFPRLQSWYSWFNRTQVGPVSGSYRWRGRDPNNKAELNPKTLTSGLDDYPRATHPNEDEKHLDLRCWMVLASRVMSRIATTINCPSAASFRDTAAYLSDNQVLDSLHWSLEHRMYCDYGLHSLKVKLVRPKGNPELPKVRQEFTSPSYGCVPEFGYVSLFPFILQVIEPSSDKLGILLKQIEDPSLLWTPFGLRSLTKNSAYYRKYNTETDPPYWRGAVWVNLNYLVLRSLHHYSHQPGPHQQLAVRLYSQLRHNIVSNLFKEYRRSGYLWEQYDDVTGEGKGSHPFTGWSALVVLMMAEEF